MTITKALPGMPVGEVPSQQSLKGVQSRTQVPSATHVPCTVSFLARAFIPRPYRRGGGKLEDSLSHSNPVPSTVPLLPLPPNLLPHPPHLRVHKSVGALCSERLSSEKTPHNCADPPDPPPVHLPWGKTEQEEASFSFLFIPLLGSLPA